MILLQLSRTAATVILLSLIALIRSQSSSEVTSAEEPQIQKPYTLSAFRHHRIIDGDIIKIDLNKHIPGKELLIQLD